jgi:hypothetical protein
VPGFGLPFASISRALSGDIVHGISASGMYGAGGGIFGAFMLMNKPWCIAVTATA